MASIGTAPAREAQLRYSNNTALIWARTEAPCVWQGNIDVQFRMVSFALLEPAGSWTDPAIVERWWHKMKRGHAVPPPIVCRTEHGTYYIRDGNHRYEAMERLFGRDSSVMVRVGLVIPRPGFVFQYRWFQTYGTYLLEPQAEPLPAVSLPFRSADIEGSTRVTMMRLPGPNRRATALA